MLIGLVVASILWRARAVAPALVVVAAFRFPAPALAAAGVWAVVARLRRDSGPSPDDEARMLDRVIGELEGGASPRAALVAVARRSRSIDLSVPARLVAAGMPADRVSRALGSVLPHNGRLTAAAWALAGEAGAPAAPVMRLLARRAAERGRLERERWALTAQARATAWLIAGMPLAVLGVLVLSGRVGPGPALPVVAVGVALQLAGLGVVVAMLRTT